MLLSEFQKEIIHNIASGKITSMASFLIEICRKDINADYYINIIKNSLLDPDNYETRLSIILPYQESVVMKMFNEFYALLSILELNDLLFLSHDPLPNHIQDICCQTDPTIKDKNNGIIASPSHEVTVYLRKHAYLNFTPLLVELNAFIKRNFRTKEEENLDKEKKHRNAQFCIALGMAIVTVIFGIIAAFQDSSKEKDTSVKTTQATIDTIVVQSLLDTALIKSLLIETIKQNVTQADTQNITPNKLK